MPHSWFKRLAAVSVTVAVLAVALAARQRGDSARLFGDVFDRVRTAALDSLSESQLYEKAARGLVRQLNDPYADLYSAEELARFRRNQLGADYAGLGMGIEQQAQRVMVTTVFPGSPAALGGVEAGDHIIAIDGVSTVGWSADRVSKQLMGAMGTAVEVTFERAGVTNPVRTRFKRSVIHISSVPYALMVVEHIGYVPLQRFSSTATMETEQAIARLREAGANEFILDLRGNGGGELDQALGVSNLFLDSGSTLASVRDRARGGQSLAAQQQPILRHEPVIVLVDRYTASASEIVAGALQDHDRAIVVGTTSFGKGLVQTMFPLEDGWSLKMTTGRWYTPRGRSIHRTRAYENGHFVETDSEPRDLSAAAARAGRPTVLSDGGRTLYGGGGIVPDVVVAAETLSTAGQHFMAALAPQRAAAQAALFDIARDLRGHVSSDFGVTPAWRTRYVQRLQTAGVPLTDAAADSLAPLIDRMIANRVATVIFGDSAGYRREAPHDLPLQRAIDLLRRAPTTTTLLAAARDANG